MGSDGQNAFSRTPSVYNPAPTLTLSLTLSRASLSPSDPPARAGPIQGGCAAFPVAAGGLPAAPPPPPNRRAPLSSYPGHLSLSSGWRTTTGSELTTGLPRRHGGPLTLLLQIRPPVPHSPEDVFQDYRARGPARSGRSPPVNPPPP
jgi:hypothetical protein